MLVSILVLSSISVANPSVASKAGSSCKVLGATAIESNIRYTCIKSKNKLIWDNGVKVQNNSHDIPCSEWGKRIQNNNRWLECRYSAGNLLKYFQISKSPKYSYSVASPEPFSTCQIPDASPNPNNDNFYPGYVIGRKENSNIPTSGKLKIALIAVDYSDEVAKTNPKETLQTNAVLIKRWFTNYTNGKVQAEVQYYDKWLRAPRESKFYNWGHPDASNVTPLSDEEMVQDYVNIADPYIDLKDIGAIFIIHPTSINKIQYGIMRMIRSNSSEGQIAPFVVSIGRVSIDQKAAPWAVFLHELLHPMGLLGHAPGNGWPFNIMTALFGKSLALSTWDRILLDWIDPQEVYCDKSETLKKAEITLTSMDAEISGVKAAVIKVSSHEALVIESRRKDYWSTSTDTLSGSEFEDGFYGVMVYRVDTSKRNDRSNEGHGDNGNDPKYDKFAYYLKISDKHLTKGDPNGYFKYVMYEGESVTSNGIRISLIKSGDFDTVRIEKIS